MAAGLGALSIHTVNVMGTFRYQFGPGVLWLSLHEGIMC